MGCCLERKRKALAAVCCSSSKTYGWGPALLFVWLWGSGGVGMGGWMDGWVDGWMDGDHVSRQAIYLYVIQYYYKNPKPPAQKSTHRMTCG